MSTVGLGDSKEQHDALLLDLVLVGLNNILKHASHEDCRTWVSHVTLTFIMITSVDWKSIGFMSGSRTEAED